MSLYVEVRARRGGFEVTAAFRANAGETVALLGPNGAGKSTLVAALSGLLEPPPEGRVALEGEVLDRAEHHVPPQARPVGVVFQDLLLFPTMTALENVAFPLRARGTGRHEAHHRALAWLERLGVGLRAHARPGALSGGEAQRVALARALVGEPRLLLLDEPLSSLDVRARSEVRALLAAELERFEGVRVLVTHDPVEAMTLADRIVVLEDGAVTQDGTPDEIREAPRTPYAAELVGVNRFEGRLEPLEEGAGRLRTADGEVVVAWPPGLPREAVDGALALLRPADVALSPVRPEGSQRNVLRGEIASISMEGDRARVRVRTSPPVTAEVTLGSVERLRLRPSTEVWVAFKAVELRVVVP